MTASIILFPGAAVQPPCDVELGDQEFVMSRLPRIVLADLRELERHAEHVTNLQAMEILAAAHVLHLKTVARS